MSIPWTSSATNARRIEAGQYKARQATLQKVVENLPNSITEFFGSNIYYK
jgi:hypothetical protein